MQHSITTSAVFRAMWRAACAFIVALLAGLMLTQKAEADSFRVSCHIYATKCRPDSQGPATTTTSSATRRPGTLPPARACTNKVTPPATGRGGPTRVGSRWSATSP